MNVADIISNIQWIQVFILTIFSFLLGTLWHQPFLFGTIWKKENNAQNINQKINAPLIFGGTAIMHFLSISGLSAFASGKGGTEGLFVGFFISIVWILPAMAGTYLFANRSIKLLGIDSGMYIFLFTISGYILGIW